MSTKTCKRRRNCLAGISLHSSRFCFSILLTLLLGCNFLAAAALADDSEPDSTAWESALTLLSAGNTSSGIPDNWNTLPCRNFSKVPLPNNKTDNADFRCLLIRNLTGCRNDQSFIPYLSLIYCSFSRLQPVAIVIIVVWLVFLFVSLGSTAEDFFCPALTTISQTLGLSQNIAGVTFLAFGNGAPDIFSAFAAIQQAQHGDAGLAIGALFGAGVFVTTIVVGSICWSQSFALTQRPFLRDVIFYLAAVFMTFTVLWEHRMTTYLAAAFVLLYVLYVIVVIGGRYVYQKMKKRKRGGDIPSPAVHESGEELGAGISHSAAARAEINSNGDTASISSERTPLLSPTNSSRPLIAGSINSDGFAGSDDDGDVDGGGGASSPPSRTDRRDGRGLLRRDSRLRSDSFHGITAHQRQTNRSSESQDVDVETRQAASAVVNAAAGHEENTDAALRAYHDDMNLVPHQHARMRRSTIYVAGVLAGLAAPAVPSTSLRRASSFTNLSPGAVRADHVANGGAAYGSVNPARSNTGAGGGASALSSLMDRHAARAESVATPAVAMPLKTFLLAISPIDRETFADANAFWKLYEIFKAPIQFLLTISTPVVLLDQEDSNWNRPLNSFHCVTGPVIITLLVSGINSYIANVVPTLAVVAAGGLALAVLVFLTSRNDKPPRYHRVFAFVGFAVAVVWIYAIANEIVSLLQTLGIFLNISDAILGLTLLAWGNSIGDLVSNTTMARQGFARMAIAACYGGPLLNVLLGIGLASLAKSIREGGSFCLHFKPLQVICASFLMTSLCISLLAMLFVLKFNSSKKFAVSLFIFYLLFLAAAFLTEFDIIHWSLNFHCK